MLEARPVFIKQNDRTRHKEYLHTYPTKSCRPHQQVSGPVSISESFQRGRMHRGPRLGGMSPSSSAANFPLLLHSVQVPCWLIMSCSCCRVRWLTAASMECGTCHPRLATWARSTSPTAGLCGSAACPTHSMSAYRCYRYGTDKQVAGSCWLAQAPLLVFHVIMPCHMGYCSSTTCPDAMQRSNVYELPPIRYYLMKYIGPHCQVLNNERFQYSCRGMP